MVKRVVGAPGCLTRSRINAAIDDEEFALAFQRIVPTTGVHEDRFEVLARWSVTGGRQVPPAAFIPAVESASLEGRFTHFVITAAARQWLRWRSSGWSPHLSVNVWPRVLRDSTVLEAVDAVASEGFDPSRLTVEVLEHQVVADRSAVDTMNALRSRGVRFSIDDFGRGDASLVNLQRFRFDELKIDRCFVRRMIDDRASRGIVRFALQLGHFLEMDVVAEGIEDPLTHAAVTEYGVDAAQGFWLHRPQLAPSIPTVFAA